MTLIRRQLLWERSVYLLADGSDVDGFQLFNKSLF